MGPVAQASGARTYHLTICEENDAQNIYFAVQIDVGYAAGQNVPAFWFDSPDDGKVAAGDPAGGCAAAPAPVEDAIDWNMVSPGVYEDNYYCFSNGLAVGLDGQSDGQGGCTINAANTQQSCEFAKPLSSGDADDFSLTAGDTVGWCFTFDDQANNANAIGNFAGDIQYPAGCWLDKANKHGAVEGSAANYANAKIDGPLVALIGGLNAKLGKYLAICKRCPPDPTKFLQGELRQVRVALSAGKRSSAVRALKSFIKSAQRFSKARRFPGARAAGLVARARRLIVQVQHAPSMIRTPFSGTAKRKPVTMVLPTGNAAP